ncbi:hypothetical protein CapIbe_001825 [Capra ibex]
MLVCSALKLTAISQTLSRGRKGEKLKICPGRKKGRWKRKTQGTARTGSAPLRRLTACSPQGHTISHPSLYLGGLEWVPASLLALQCQEEPGTCTQ